MTKVFSIAMTLLTVYLASPESNAAGIAPQNNVQTQQVSALMQPVSTTKQQEPTRSAYEFQSQTLTQMVELPEVPQYTGQMTFVAGTYFPNAKSGGSYTLKVRTLEYQESVRSWYEAALQQTGWKIETQMCNEHTVAAWKNKQLVQIVVMPPSHHRFRSDVLIRFRNGS